MIYFTIISIISLLLLFIAMEPLSLKASALKSSLLMRPFTFYLFIAFAVYLVALLYVANVNTLTNILVL